MWRTKIKRLPASIKCLERLQAICLDGCEYFSCLPMSIYKLKHVGILSLNGCSKFEKYPELEKNSCSSKPSASPRLKKLILKNCNLQEVDILLKPHWFNSLTHLDLSGNPFVSLPRGIKRLFNPKWLGLENCEQLLAIPDLPLSIKRFHARGCKLLENVHLSGLSREFSVITHMDFSNCHNMIWSANSPSSQELKGKSCISIYFPRREIPRWFGHKNEGSSLRIRVPVPKL